VEHHPTRVSVFTILGSPAQIQHRQWLVLRVLLTSEKMVPPPDVRNNRFSKGTSDGSIEFVESMLKVLRFLCMKFRARDLAIWFSTCWGLHWVAPRIADWIAWVSCSPFRPRSWIPELTEREEFGGFGHENHENIMTLTLG
jgi:hypothetical protein